jgi:ribosomal protein L2
MRRLRRAGIMIRRRIRVSLNAGRMMGMSILMDVHGALMMDVDHPGGMIRSQAMRHRVAARQGEGQRRRQHAKQIRQGS